MADPLVCTCSNCGGAVLVRTGSLPLGDMKSGVFQFSCPMCGGRFPLGYVTECADRTRTVQEETQMASRRESERQAYLERTAQVAGQKRTSSSGPPSGGQAASSGAGQSPNDDRSNAMNPNNPAYRAGANNRSNQMNPDSPAYRSSRGGRR